MTGLFRFALALFRVNCRNMLTLRVAFLVQVIFMIANNLIFFAVWWFFFQHVEQVNAYRLRELCALYGVVAGAFGIAVFFFGGWRTLAQTIADGGLDPFLVQPKNVLLHVLASRSYPSGLGDIITAGLLFFFSGYFAWSDAPLLVLCMALSVVLFLSFVVLVHSAAFFFGEVQQIARQVCDFLILFSVYPQSIYEGVVKVLLFTALPAGFIGFLPVELVRHFEWLTLTYLLAGVLAYAALAHFSFKCGLARYASGSRFGIKV